MNIVFWGSKKELASFNFPTIHRTKGTSDYIHLDLWGSSRVPSEGGAKYILTFINE